MAAILIMTQLRWLFWAFHPRFNPQRIRKVWFGFGVRWRERDQTLFHVTFGVPFFVVFTDLNENQTQDAVGPPGKHSLDNQTAKHNLIHFHTSICKATVSQLASFKSCTPCSFSPCFPRWAVAASVISCLTYSMWHFVLLNDTHGHFKGQSHSHESYKCQPSDMFQSVIKYELFYFLPSHTSVSFLCHADIFMSPQLNPSMNGQRPVRKVDVMTWQPSAYPEIRTVNLGAFYSPDTEESAEL